jgi:Tol biopolymer transport system component
MRLLTLLLIGLSLVVLSKGAQAQESTPTPVPTPDGNVWISLDSASGQLAAPSGAYSYSPSVSANGNYVAFQTLSNLQRDGDRNGMEDIFRRDIANATTTPVSLAADGTYGNNRSYAPDMTADGATIVFESLATNFVPGDANNAPDIYLRDMTAATTTRITAGAGGVDANGASFRPAISANGAYIAFCSRATNLVAGETGGAANAFLFERATGTFTKIPIDSNTNTIGGCERVAIDDLGQTVAVSALTDNTGRVFTYDRASATTTELIPTADGSSGLSGLAISGDGRFVAFDSGATNLISDDSNRSRDVFVANVADKTVSRASVRTSGTQLPGDSGMSGVSLSEDGRFVVFGTEAADVVPGDSNGHEDVFRRDLVDGQTTIVSVNPNGRPTNDSSYAPVINADGSIVAYTSLAANIVGGDSNRQGDVFVRATTFLDKDGEARPEESGAPKDNVSEAAIARDESNTTVLYVGGAIAGGVFVLVAGWFLLGRRGRA